MELSVVLEDLKTGPQASAPNDAPSGVSNLTLEDEFLTLSLLEDHTISGSFDGVSTMLSNQAFASAFFSDLVDTYDALSNLESTNDSTNDAADNIEYALGGRNVSISSGIYNFVSSA